ncbi:MAG: radical SAM protein [Nitrospirae bacterium]|nr:radical SAM protein [Nitrospirota bacterium]
MRINETFFSIQGESTFAGWPCFFIRTTGCPLRCRWCDTAYAFYEGEERTVVSLVGEAAGHSAPLVEITGGEPFVAPELPELVKGLLELRKTVLIETSGAFPVPAGLDRRCRIIMDVKPPGSGMSHTMREETFRDLHPGDEVKAVVAGREDFDWTLAFLDRAGLSGEIPVTLSPVFGECRPEDLAAWVLSSGRNLRVQVQLHKILFDPGRRGV